MKKTAASLAMGSAADIAFSILKRSFE